MSQMNLFPPKGEQLVNRLARLYGPGPEGSTCGACSYFRREAVGEKTYFKCGLENNTRGMATDIRQSWPGCMRFLDRAKAEEETPAGQPLYADDATHRQTMRDVKGSIPARDMVACIFGCQGAAVERGETTYAKAHENWREHSDKYDMIVEGRYVEVKNLGYDYTWFMDWPHRSYFITNQHRLDDVTKWGTTPAVYISLNKAWTHVGIVYTTWSRANEYWRRVPGVKDRRTGRRQDKWEMDANFVHFLPLEDLDWWKIDRVLNNEKYHG